MSSELENLIPAWLDAVYFEHSQSEATRAKYRAVFTDFLTYLAEQGLSLDPWQHIPADASAVSRSQVLSQFAFRIQEFALRPRWRGPSGRHVGQLAPKTVACVVTIISSFYSFASRHGFLLCANPCERIKKPRSQSAPVRGLALEEVRTRMAAIERESLLGMRDYAMLATYLETGRRLSEVAELRWGDVDERDGRLTLSFRRLKGGKRGANRLSTSTSYAVLVWLLHAYPGAGRVIEAESPLFFQTRLSRLAMPAPLSSTAIEEICLRRLGTSQVHRLRHTMAASMRRAGFALEEVREALAHESLVTTQRYLALLLDEQDERGEKIAAFFGFS